MDFEMLFVLQDYRRAWICRASVKQAFERTQRARASAGKAVAEPSALNEGSCWSLKYCDRLQPAAAHLTALGMWSTYWGLMVACKSSSRMRVK